MTRLTHTTGDPLIAFLYELMRDHVPPGVVEKVVRNSELPSEDDTYVLSNVHLARYAEEIAIRLRPASG